MRTSVGEHGLAGSEELTAEQQAAAKATKHWVQQLARTIKTCRLYDSLTSPAVERLRAELANELRGLLETHGTIALRFTSDDILTEGMSLYPARSREDNLALPFYRDGVRSITFSPGVEPTELNRVIDAILSVTGHRQTEDDLVTLLWQAQLGHVQIEYVPSEAEIGGGDSMSGGPGGSGGGGSGSPGTGGGSGSGSNGGSAPAGSGGEGSWVGDGGESATFGSVAEGASDLAWPQEGGAEAGEEAEAGGAQQGIGARPQGTEADAPKSGDTADAANGSKTGRSDDWQVDAEAVEAQMFDELELVATPGLDAFRARLEAERNVPAVLAGLELCRAYLAASDTSDDRFALAPFLSSVIRQAATQGEWSHAGIALTMLGASRSPAWSVDPLGEELCHPRVLSRTVAGFEALDVASVDEFIAFARRLGDWSVDLLGPVIMEIEGTRHETRLLQAIAAECRDCPERLAPWLADSRWPVVRTTVRILGEIGGNSVPGLLATVAAHPEAAVRDAVAAALEDVPLPLAKPALIGLLDDADTRTFCSILQRLGKSRDKDVAELMAGYLTRPEFARQPAEEKRAVYATLGSSGTDDVLPTLEAELHNQNWLDGGQEAHRQSVALCIVQIGTPYAKQILQRGARSRRAALAKTCKEMLGRFGRS